MSESEFVWATVTTAGPLPGLRVLLDGDAAPLPTPPHDTLVDPLALTAGDRVRCEWERTRNGRRLVIHDRAGGGALAAYPVGSIYISVNATNPADLFGGEWSRFAAGRVLVGVQENDADFATVERMGGTKSVTLTVEQMPSHTHTQDAHSHTSAAHTHAMPSRLIGLINAPGGVASSFSGGWVANVRANPGGWIASTLLDLRTAGHAAAVTAAGLDNVGSTTPPATGSTTPAINATGGGQAHTNLQPFITCFMWVRTA